MMTDHQKFQNVTAGIQSIVIAIALVVSGIFTLYVFIVVNRAEQQRQAHSGLGIQIDAKQEQLGSQQYVISAVVKITNRATAPRFIDLTKYPLQVWKVKFDTEGHSERTGPLLGQPNVLSESRVVRSGETVDYPYLVQVKEKGLYFITLLVKLTGDEFQVHKQSGGPEGEPPGNISWDGNAYVAVR